MKHLLEICVDSLASARAAIQGGADRLELCSGLAVGGMTPYVTLLQQIRKESNIPIRCLIRTRPGDFLYTEGEVSQMCCQISMLHSAGADGFVIGCLNADGSLCKRDTQMLIRSAGSAGLTLHRCIDVSADLEQTYRDAWELGFDTVLTSGGCSACLQGMETISSLLALRKILNGPEILIGAGVSAAVIKQFLTVLPSCSAFHMSGKKEIESEMKFRREGVPMGLPGLDEWHIQQTDAEAVRQARSVLDQF